MTWPRKTEEGTGEGRAARERAEVALKEARERRELVRAFLAPLHRDLAKNHYAEAITKTFRGGNR
jgi:hypothetical protein